MNCKSCVCKRACEILGQCVRTHDYLKDSPFAQEALDNAWTVKNVLTILNRHTKKRMIFSAGKYKPFGEVIKPTWVERKKKEPIPQPTKEFKMVALDPVTVMVHKARIKREAVRDAEAGYIFQEKEYKNFHLN